MDRPLDLDDPGHSSVEDTIARLRMCWCSCHKWEGSLGRLLVCDCNVVARRAPLCARTWSLLTVYLGKPISPCV